jgi:hypothetical protein
MSKAEVQRLQHVINLYESEFKRLKSICEADLEGCGDNSCWIAKPRGMATNGGCRCTLQAFKIAVRVLRDKVKRYEV